MNCPRCSSALAPAEANGVGVLRCARCQGTWVDEDGFREAQNRADPEHDWLHLELWREHERFDAKRSTLACPSCGEPLVAMAYGDTGVEIDHCPACAGIWLEEQELANLVAAIEAEASAMPAGELLSAALREAGGVLRGEGSLAEEWTHLGHVLGLLKLRVLADHPGLRQALLQIQRGTPLG
jgi:Zn-finger nucleic acid-binding protein